MSFDFKDVNLQGFPLFEGVDEATIRQFISAGFCFQYEAGTPIVSSKDLGETFFLTVHGLAKLVLENSRSEEINITLFRSGDFFGEIALLDPSSARTANVVAVTDVVAIAVHRKEFFQMMNACPTLALNITRVLGRRLISMNERMLIDRLPDHTSKVAHTLVFFADKGNRFSDPGTILLPPLPLKEWALFCYTVREDFMDSMEKLKKAGAIQWQNQRIAITNMDVLRRFAAVYPVA